MATYFHGNSDIQGGGDGLQTLILMNPAYVGYSENQQPAVSGNFVFINSNSTGNGINLPHAPPTSQTQHFVGVPLQGGAAATSSQQEVSALHGFFPRLHSSRYNQQIEMAAARDVPRPHQGLSLSLSSQQPAGFGSFGFDREASSQPLLPAGSQPREDDARVVGGSPSSASAVSNCVNGVLLSSKYLKATQEILDEVVKVGKVAELEDEQPKKIGESSSAAAAAGGDGFSGEKRGAELTTAGRQEIQMKKAKLVNMLEKVEQRYREYHHQMQLIISWFEQAAGIGSAKIYTALALQTISKQFRCLKDAILGQIRAASRSLGEEDCLGGKMEGSKLKYVDNQIRQQRALLQLGMIQHNAWRPQRGLPERSVSVLRAWLFEHFLHPYPKDSDKIMLSKQTGLTRSQVSNWFINARVRLWKPMVEEMYMEEVKDQETGSQDNPSKSDQYQDSSPKSTDFQGKNPAIENQNNFVSNQDSPMNQTMSAPMSMSTSLASPTGANGNAGFHHIGSSAMGNITQGSPKKQRNSEMLDSLTRIATMSMDSKSNISDNEHMSLKFGCERQNRDSFTLLGTPTNFIGGFGSYPLSELGRFSGEQFQAPYSGNAVSLTLGLPHCENLTMPGSHQNFLANQTIQLGRDIGNANTFSNMSSPPASDHSNVVYETMNIQNPRGSMHDCCPTL